MSDKGGGIQLARVQMSSSVAQASPHPKDTKQVAKSQKLNISIKPEKGEQRGEGERWRENCPKSNVEIARVQQKPRCDERI